MSSPTESELRTIHALHGHAVMGMRDAKGDEERRMYAEQARAYKRVLGVLGYEWRPWDGEELLKSYEQISKAVLEADETHDDGDDDPRIGMQ